MKVSDLKSKLADLPDDADLYIKDVPGSNYGLVKVSYVDEKYANTDPESQVVTILIQ